MPTCLDTTHYYRDPELEGNPVEEAIEDLQRDVKNLQNNKMGNYQFWTEGTHNVQYYVDSIAGNDNNDGSKPTKAWKNLDRALEEILNKKKNDVRIRLRGKRSNQSAPVEYVLGGSCSYNASTGQYEFDRHNGQKTISSAAIWITGVQGNEWDDEITSVTDIPITNGLTDVRPVRIRISQGVSFYQSHLNLNNVEVTHFINTNQSSDRVGKLEEHTFYGEGDTFSFHRSYIAIPFRTMDCGTHFNNCILSIYQQNGGVTRFDAVNFFDNNHQDPGYWTGDSGLVKPSSKMYFSRCARCRFPRVSGEPQSIRYNGYTNHFIWADQGSMLTIDYGDHHYENIFNFNNNKTTKATCFFEDVFLKGFGKATVSSANLIPTAPETGHEPSSLYFLESKNPTGYTNTNHDVANLSGNWSAL